MRFTAFASSVMSIRQLSKRIAIAIMLLVPFSAVAAADKRPVPSQADQNAAVKLVKEVFKADYAKAKLPNDKLILAQKLLKQGVETEDDPVGRFALFREARELATDVGSVDVALNAIEAISEQFEIDFNKMVVETLTKAKRVSKPAGLSNQDLIRVMGLIDQAVQEDDFEFASAMCPIAMFVAKNTSADSLKSVNIRTSEIDSIQKAYGASRIARQTLVNSPDDPEACLTDGKYLCFLKGNWATGLPLLARSSNSTLKALAENDIAEPTEAAAQIAVADGWRTLAEKETGLARGQLALRSKYWYEQSEKSLTGLTAAKVKKQVDVMNSFLKETSLAGVSSSGFSSASTSGKKPPPIAVAPFDEVRAKRHQQAWASFLKQPATLKNSIGMQFKLIPPGEYLSGSPETEEGRRPTETQRKVKIANPFCFGMYEVTQRQYSEVMGQNPSEFKGEENPVERVSWNDAIEFCRKLSERSKESVAGRSYRLPTSDEWEVRLQSGNNNSILFWSGRWPTD